jgi:DNA-directed RNA polymerase
LLAIAQLAVRIGADRAIARDKAVWRALKDIDDEEIALRLLVAGITVCGSDSLGTDEEGDKNFRDIALWIGQQFGCGRELGLKVGAWGVNMLLVLPVFELVGDVLKLRADVSDFMDDVLAQAVRNNPLISPTMSPPLRWTQFRRGGLPAGHWALGSVPLVRSLNPSTEAVMRKAIGTGKMRPVLDAVNYLQSTAYCINEPVLDLMRRLGPKRGLGPSELSVWEMDIVTARAMSCCERFYVPHNLDFRGRANPIPTFHFQRADSIRGLFLFADGEPIGERGRLWLMSHVAACADGNTWSKNPKPSKLRPADRVYWTGDNLQILRDIGNAVLRGDDPKTLPPLPGDPCQFVAGCAELVQALDDPDFLTRLPITVDASCSGLQHLCAMTRDDEGGAYVNLIPSNMPEDFYARVAIATWEANPAIRSLMMDECDRGLVKQPAMSYFYGSRPGGFAKIKKRWRGKGKPLLPPWQPYGMTKQVVSVLKDRGVKSTKGAKELAHTINHVIEGMLPKPKAVRDFLEELAKLCADKNKSLHWKTPLGLPVLNRYHEPDIKTISVLLNGRRRRVNLTIGDKPEIDKAGAINAVTANFTHSADACHLQMVALEAAREGIPLVTVHDCFGTTAPHAIRLLDIVRGEFVRLHKRHNLLAGVLASAQHDLPKHVELPPLPQIGSLDLDGVLFSHNAFK